MATIFRPPVVGRRDPFAPSLVSTTAHLAVVGTLLLTTLAGQDKITRGAGMASLQEFPNPRGAAYPVALRTWAPPSLVLSTLKGKDQFFGGAGAGPDYDWPNPSLGRAYPISQRTWTQNLLQTTLKGVDTFFGGPGKAPNYDWPNPSLGASRSIALRTHTQALVTTTLKGKDQFFGVAGAPLRDWPNPRGPASSIDRQTWAPPGSLALLTVPVAVPIQPIDWPNPRGAAYPSLLLTWTQSPAVIPAPFVPIAWPNPTLVRAALPRDPANLLTTGLVSLDRVPVVEFTNPRIARRVSSEVGTQSLALATVAPPLTPIVWPVPLSTARGRLADPPNLLTSTLQATGTPLLPPWWSNPTLEVRRIVSFTANAFVLGLAPTGEVVNRRPTDDPGTAGSRSPDTRMGGL